MPSCGSASCDASGSLAKRRLPFLFYGKKSGIRNMKSRIHLSEHFTYRKLLRFTLPSVVMNLFASVYIVADGYFVANFAGKT